MFNLMVICGGMKTGKTKLGKLTAFLSGAVLADDCEDPNGVLMAHMAASTGPLVMIVMEPKDKEDWPVPLGHSMIQAAADIIIRMPHMTIVKDRYDVF
ncbi:hypothetical protein LCGC14_2718640 [marine sediment metagenome]|uniref:Uncharacterized protein n=1 Tax=marine sediment metagenome TaxID=412755 RepID=A0A0F8ZYB3_9ZZZZ